MNRLRIAESVGDFAGDKDVATALREDKIKPILSAGRPLVLDFGGVEFATQSFIHALVSQLIRSDDFNALSLLTFENCTPSLRELIEIVADYSQEDMAGE